MAKCKVCNNDYDKSFEVVKDGKSYTFDSFECAINLLAPVCNNCGNKIIGHGMENAGKFYCCAQCARNSGVTELQDRA